MRQAPRARHHPKRRHPQVAAPLATERPDRGDRAVARGLTARRALGAEERPPSAAHRRPHPASSDASAIEPPLRAAECHECEPHDSARADVQCRHIIAGALERSLMVQQIQVLTITADTPDGARGKSPARSRLPSSALSATPKIAPVRRRSSKPAMSRSRRSPPCRPRPVGPALSAPPCRPRRGRTAPWSRPARRSARAAGGAPRSPGARRSGPDGRGAPCRETLAIRQPRALC